MFDAGALVFGSPYDKCYNGGLEKVLKVAW